jgi:thymidine phosphorylase
VLDCGAAAERFAGMVSALGGPRDLLDAPERYLAHAAWVVPVTASEAGFVTRIDCRALGLAVVGLGGGRHRPEERIDHQVGLTDCVELGQYVEKGTPLALIHARDRQAAGQAAVEIRAAFTLNESAAAIPATVYGLIE